MAGRAAQTAGITLSHSNLRSKSSRFETLGLELTVPPVLEYRWGNFAQSRLQNCTFFLWTRASEASIDPPLHTSSKRLCLPARRTGSFGDRSCFAKGGVNSGNIRGIFPVRGTLPNEEAEKACGQRKCRKLLTVRPFFSAGASLARSIRTTRVVFERNWPAPRGTAATNGAAGRALVSTTGSGKS
jgi:hypothetical protein